MPPCDLNVFLHESLELGIGIIGILLINLNVNKSSLVLGIFFSYILVIRYRYLD